MAYLLRYNAAQGTASEITFPTWVGAGNGNWSVIVSFICTSFSSTPRILGQLTSTTNRALVIGTTGFLSWVSVGIAGAAGSIQLNTRYWVKLESVGTTKNLYQSTDGVNYTLVGTTTYSAANMDWSKLGSASNVRSQVFDFYSIEFSGSTYTDAFNATTAPSTGTSWPSVGGTRNLTLTNFTGTTDSWWVFYNTGGAIFTMIADGASWSYTGGAASTLLNRLLTAGGVSSSYSGGVASTLYNRMLSADGASWQWQGESAGLYCNRSMQADGAQWSYALADATLNYVTGSTVYTLIADGSQWSYSAGDAALLLNRVIYADGQQFNYSGADAGTIYHRSLSADGASYQYQLAGAQTLYNRVLLADGAGFSYAGGAATLSYSGAVIVSITSYTMAYEQAQASASYSAMPISANYSKLTVSARYKDGVI